MAMPDDLAAVDPHGLLTGLIAQQAPALAQNDTIEPQSLMNRLIRKSLDSDQRRELERRQKTSQPSPQSGAADFSSYGKTADEIAAEPPVDFSEFGQTTDEQVTLPPAKPKENIGVIGNAKALGKGLVRGPIDTTGEALKGAALGPEITKQAYDQLKPNQIEQTEPEKPEQSAQANPNYNKVAGPYGKEIRARRAQQEAAQANIAEAMKTPVEQRPLYKAGEAVSQFGERAVPMSDAEKSSFGGVVGHGIGSVVPLVAAGVVSPPAAIAGGAAVFGLSGAGHSYDDAIKKGASPEVAAQAAGLNGMVGAAVGVLPLGSVLKPFTALLPETQTLVVRMLAQAAQNGIVFASVGEAQEYLGQQIAKNLYDPQAGYSPDVKRVLASLVTGGILGAAHSALPERKAAGRQDNDSTGAGDDRNQPPMPPFDKPPPEYVGKGFEDKHPKTGENTWFQQVGPDTFATNDGQYWTRKADTKASEQSEKQTEEETPGPAPGAEQSSSSDKADEPPPPKEADNGFARGSAEEMAARRARAREEGIAREKAKQEQAAAEKARKQSEGTPEQRRRKKLEELAGAHNEHSAEDIAKWDDETLKDYVNVKAGYGSSKQPDDMLRKAGVSDDEIKTMSPERKAAMVDELHNAVSSALDDEIGKINLGTREKPVDLKTGEDVAKAASVATTDYTPEQGEANNVQRGHAKWNGLDLTIETPAGGTRRGTNPKTGEPWETTHTVPYGYIKNTVGADNMHVDVYLGPEPDTADKVYVLNENDGETGAFRQHKAMIGFPSSEAAREAYLGTSSKQPEHIGGIRALSPDEFTTWLKEGDTKAAISIPETAGSSPSNKVSNETGTSADTEQPSSTEMVDVTHEHHAAIEKALTAAGIDVGEARPADIAHAAEIHAHEGAPPIDAFIVAVARSLAADGHIKPEDAKGILPDENVLESGEDAERGLRAAPSGPATDRPAAEGKESLAANGNETPVAETDGSERQGPATGNSTKGRGAENNAAGGEPNATGGARKSSGARSEGSTANSTAENAKHPVAAEAPAAKPKSEWTEVGKNSDGRTLFEDQGGVRSYVENGVRVTEPVAIRPTRSGVEAAKPEHKDEWQLVPASSEAKPIAEAESARPDVSLARALLSRIQSGLSITHAVLQQEATKAYGGKLSEGKFDRKDAQDALELAVNLAVKADPKLRIGTDGEWREPMKRLDQILSRLPTQRVRSEEQDSFQQFSTPPNYAAAAVYAAKLRAGDTVLEPSAGTGSLVAAASEPGVKIIANELSERRAPLLRELAGKNGRVFTENAEQIDNILPEDVKPTVVMMNPPFSQTAGRMGNRKVPMVAAEHIESALSRLEPGGRLVAIVGRGMAMGAPTYRGWWEKISKNNTIKANIGVDGKAYEKYGTTFGTRLVVIDKVEPTAGHSPVLVEAQTVDDLMRALEPIRDGRANSNPVARTEAKREPAQPSSAPLAAAGQSKERPAAPPAPVEPGSVGSGKPSDGGVAGSGSGGAAGSSGQPVRVEAGDRDGVAPVESERTGAGGRGTEPVIGDQERKRAEAGGGLDTERDLQPPAGEQPGAAASSERVELEQTAKPGTQARAEISDSLYDAYEPQRVRVKGAKPHPGPLVQSAAMASVDPPTPKYKPQLPRDVIDGGKLSIAQLEAVIYAGQAHQDMLPAAEGQKPKRRGFFIGDGTGVGKGREVGGIILDNWHQGRTKAVWVSEKKTLLQDAKRDWAGLGGQPSVLFDVGKVKAGEPLKAQRGIGFITYDTLKGGLSDQAAIARGQFVRKQRVSVNGQPGTVQRIQGQGRNQPQLITVKLENGTEISVPAGEVNSEQSVKVKTRVDQIVEWFGKDFDGVIAFDEAHNMGNATDIKGERGQKDAAQKAVAGMQLQDRLPNARVVYVSATGATEVSNLAYADRLGLWGRGTAFASQAKFVAEVEKGGMAAMELVARDMKQLGLYTARNLSYDGVEYERLEHKLDKNQREIYDTLAEAWQVVLRNINAALDLTGGNLDSRAKSAAMSAFWGGHQRFFNQVITSMQMPSVIKAVEKDIAAGRQAVLQLTNTNEASQERAAAKATTAEEIEDLDITPRDQIIQLVETSFPTQEYEQYVDENGKERSRPVTDKDGNPVQNKQALRMREALIEQLGSVRVPQGPLDMVLDHFGPDVVSEVTGRGRRFVMQTDEKTGQRRRMEESRPGSSNLNETEAFQTGKKKVLIFSEAGGTGRSYHADNTSASKDARRVHYLVQGGWRADKAVQGFGRTHRTNQASAPVFKLVTTDLQGQKRFISSIARRLGQLGALTKGQRQAGDQGVFTSRDNLESAEARQALQQFFHDLLADGIEGVPLVEFEQQTGLKLRSQDDEGRVTSVNQNLPPITQFLNRLLSLKIDMQNKVFDAFSDRLDAVIEARAQAGLLDVGLETVRADKIVKESERPVHTVEGSNAETKYVKLQLSDRFTPIEFETVADNKSRKVLFWTRSPKDKVYAVAEAPSITDENGNIVDHYRIINPVSGGRVIPRNNINQSEGKWVKIDKSGAEKLWNKEIEAAPEFVTRDMHLITGAILPVWDRLGGTARVVRLQTDAGEKLLGRVVPSGEIAGTLKKLGVEAAATKIDPSKLFDSLMGGARATLANGWMLSRRMVAHEHRIELTGPSSFSEGNEVKQDGVFTERIDYKVRYFIPTEPDAGRKVLAAITKYRPVAEMGERPSTQDDLGGADTPTSGFGDNEHGPPKPSLAEGQASGGYVNTDLGPLRQRDGVEPARQFQDHVVERGRASGLEHLVAVDSDGTIIGNSSGRDNAVAVSPQLLAALKDPNRSIVVHHNHPSDGGLSNLDLAWLAMPGLHGVWAHGHEGTVARAGLTEGAREALRGVAPNRAMSMLYDVTRRVSMTFYDVLQRAVDNELITIEQMQHARPHLVSTALARAGVIDYRSNIDVGTLVADLDLKLILENAAQIAARRLLHAPEQTTEAFTGYDGGRAGSLRHIGDVGTSFERARKATAGSTTSTADDRGRQELDRAEETGQVGLPEFADSAGDHGPAPRSEFEQAILDRIVPSAKQSVLPKDINQVYTALKDDLFPIQVAAKEMAGGRHLPTEKDPYKIARLTRGSYGKAEQFLKYGSFDYDTLKNNGPSLTEALEPVKHDLDGWRAYAVAKRSIELEDRGVRTGVPYSQAKAVVAQGRKAFGAAFDAVVDYQNRLTDYMQASGILSAEAVKAMREANKDYVPFFRFMGHDKEFGRQLGGGLKTHNPVKGIKGSDRQIIDPIESIVKNTYLFVSLAERNRALRALEDLADGSTVGKEFMERVQQKRHPIKVTADEINKHLRDEGIDDEVSDTMTVFRPNAFRPAADEIAIWRDGKRRIYKVGRELAEAVNALDRDALNIVTRILAVPARMLRAGAVLSPEFIARNPVRDQFSALSFSNNGYLPVYDLVRGLGHLLKKDDVFQDWLKGGGANAAMVSLDRNYISRNIIRLTQPSLLRRGIHLATTPIQLLRALSEATENATRLGDFARSRARGKTPMTGAFEARELTLDFARSGAQTKSINALIPFWNAQVEGVDRGARSFKDNPFRTLLAVGLSITLPSILLWLANHDDERYKELPKLEKDFFWHIITDDWVNITDKEAAKVPPSSKRLEAGQWMQNKGTIWKIPKPFELGVLFGSVPERTLDAFFSDNPHAFKDLHKSVLQALLPNFIPQVAIPFIEQFANRSTFTERPLVPKYLENVLPKYQVKPFTSETAQIVGNLISKINENTSFASPSVIDNYVRQWTGGMGSHALSLIDKGLSAAGMTTVKVAPESTLADMPVIKGFISRYPSANAESIQTFYETYNERRTAKGTIDYLGKTGQREAAAAERDNRAITNVEDIHRAMGTQSKFIREIYRNDKMSPADKRQLIDATYLQMIELAKAGNKTFERTSKTPRERAEEAKRAAAP